MKIKYLSASVLPSSAANSVHVMHMCEGLRQLGHDVTLVGTTPPATDEVQHEGQLFDYYGVTEQFAIKRVARPNIKYLGLIIYSLLSVVCHVYGSGADLVYCRDYLGALLSARSRFRTIFELHEMPVSFVSRHCFKLLAASAFLERVVVISDALKMDLLKIYPRLEHKVIVAHDAARDTPESTVALTTAIGRLQVGYTGGLYKGKGVELVAEIARAMPLMDFHVVGGTGELLDRWRMATDDLDNLTFHGHVPRSQIPAYVASFDVVLLPNQRVVYGKAVRADIGRWTSPLKMFEYMASEQTIVCSDLPVLKEILSDDVNCLLCDPESIEDWVNALAKLEADPGLRARLAYRAREDFLLHHTWAKRAEKILACVEN
jgi:glycosyltransferase involved in cell wall biosynthesis